MKHYVCKAPYMPPVVARPPETHAAALEVVKNADEGVRLLDFIVGFSNLTADAALREALVGEDGEQTLPVPLSTLLENPLWRSATKDMPQDEASREAFFLACLGHSKLLASAAGQDAVKMVQRKGSLNGPPEKTVYIEGFSTEFRWTNVSKFCSKFGTVVNVNMPRQDHSKEGVTRGYAFVEFATAEEAATCARAVGRRGSQSGHRAIMKAEWLEMKARYLELMAEAKRALQEAEAPPKPAADAGSSPVTYYFSVMERIPMSWKNSTITSCVRGALELPDAKVNSDFRKSAGLCYLKHTSIEEMNKLVKTTWPEGVTLRPLSDKETEKLTQERNAAHAAAVVKRAEKQAAEQERKKTSGSIIVHPNKKMKH
jgi:hypothetical protein